MHLGESVTACVGVISRQHPSFNEHGLEEGLCVALLEYDVQNITVTYNATVVATVPWPTLPDRSCIYNASVDLPCTYNASVSLPWPDRWRRVEITLTSRGLSVHYGGELALDELQVDDYAPRDGWLVGLAARTGATRAAVHLIDKLRFTAGAAVEGSDAAVAVALNAQQFTPSAAPYRYLADAHARAVFPVGGPTAGGTYVNVSVVSPSDLDGATSVTCRFGARSTDATWEAAGPVPYVACRSPAAAAAGQVQLVVDLMHGGHALTFGSGVPYSYYPVPSVALLEPNAGPVEGGTQVVVYGTGLEFGVGPARCRFGDNVTDAVVELHTGVLLCATPESPGAVPRSTPLEVSLNGQQYHHDGVAVGATNFSYVDSEARPSRASIRRRCRRRRATLSPTWCRTCCRCRRRAARRSAAPSSPSRAIRSRRRSATSAAGAAPSRTSRGSRRRAPSSTRGASSRAHRRRATLASSRSR